MSPSCGCDPLLCVRLDACQDRAGCMIVAAVFWHSISFLPPSCFEFALKDSDRDWNAALRFGPISERLSSPRAGIWLTQSCTTRFLEMMSMNTRSRSLQSFISVPHALYTKSTSSLHETGLSARNSCTRIFAKRSVLGLSSR